MTLPDELVIEMSIEDDASLEMSISTDEEILFDIEEGISGDGRLPDYNGPYEVTPRKVQQVLETTNKSMVDDVTIFAIPYAEVTNLGGGLTATIGLE